MNTDKKRNLRDLILPILILLFAGGFAMGGLSGIRSVNTTLLQPVMDIAGEETSPTVGRLICCIAFLVVSAMLVLIAAKMEKKHPEKLLTLFGLSGLGGTLLWTAVGETSWHFGTNVPSENGVMTFVNFPRIESIQGVPIFVVMLVITIIMCRKATFSEAAYLVAFVGNWGSHLCQIATYPMILAFKPDMDMVTWYRLTGISNTVVFTALWLFLCFGKTRRETRYFASVLIYDAIGSLLFGTILGET